MKNNDPKKVGLPDFLESKTCKEETELIQDLEINGVRDLKILLNEAGEAVWREMPGDPHQDSVSFIMRSFRKWMSEQGVSDTFECLYERNVRITQSFCKKRKARGGTGAGERIPDISLFGLNRLDTEFGMPLVSEGRSMNPHVVIQFGYTHDLDTDKAALDDIMNYSGIGELVALNRPTKGILIKTMWKGAAGKSKIFGFNVYVVGQNEKCDNVPLMEYRVGSHEDILISISATDMGVPEVDVQPFEINIHMIRRMLQKQNLAEFEAKEPHDMHHSENRK